MLRALLDRCRHHLAELVEQGRAPEPPGVREFRWRFEPYRDELIFEAAGLPEGSFCWCIPAHGLHAASADALAYICQHGLPALYRNLVEEHHIRREMQPYREELELHARNGAPSRVLEHLYDRLRAGPGVAGVELMQIDPELDWQAMLLKRAEAAVKGEALLREWLSPAQRAQYDAHKSFEVIGGDTGARYLIMPAGAYNIARLDAGGVGLDRLCFMPEGDLAAGDVLLAQKIALESDERAALAVANRSAQLMDGVLVG